MSKGFIKIPRSLLEHPFVRSCPDACFRLLITILEHMAYQKCLQDDHGVSIEIQPGEFMCTYRQLEQLTGIKKSTIDRYVSSFFNVKILGHKVGHVKTIINIVHTDTREMFLKTEKIEMGQEPGQKWDKNGTQKKNRRTKELKESSSNKVADAPAAASLDFSELEKMGLPPASFKSVKSAGLTQEELNHGIAYCRSGITLKKGLGAAIIASGRGRYEIQETINPEVNKRYAMAVFESYASPDCRLEIANSGVEIIHKDGLKYYGEVLFDDVRFKQNLEKHLKERNFKQKAGKK